jgi:hypothetical protein
MRPVRLKQNREFDTDMSAVLLRAIGGPTKAQELLRKCQSEMAEPNRRNALVELMKLVRSGKWSREDGRDMRRHSASSKSLAG